MRAFSVSVACPRFSKPHPLRPLGAFCASSICSLVNVNDVFTLWNLSYHFFEASPTERLTSPGRPCKRSVVLPRAVTNSLLLFGGPTSSSSVRGTGAIPSPVLSSAAAEPPLSTTPVPVIPPRGRSTSQVLKVWMTLHDQLVNSFWHFPCLLRRDNEWIVRLWGF